MTKELLQQTLNEARSTAITVFTHVDGLARETKDAIEYMYSLLSMHFERQALAQQEQCGCREGECETKKDKTCRMTIEIAERDGIPEWTPAIGIECAISNLRDDAARLRGGNYMRIQIADDLEVIANDLAKCKPDAQQEQPASVDAYNGAREDVAIWKKRALEAEELNRKFIAELNGSTYLGEPVKQEQPEQEPCGYLDEFGNFENMLLAWTRMKEEPGVAWAPVYKRPAPTQPALSDDEILNCFYASKSEGMASYMLAVGRAIEAHCRGGATS